MNNPTPLGAVSATPTTQEKHQKKTARFSINSDTTCIQKGIDSYHSHRAFRLNHPEYGYSPRDGYVYLMKPQNANIFKIGCTVNLKTRLARMNRGRGFVIDYVCAIHAADYELLESELHIALAPYRLDGEWFVLSDQAVRSLIEITKLCESGAL